MAYKNKTYVAFDGDNDMHYYNLMKAWKQNDYSEFNFYDAHDINTARDTSSVETIKTRLRERMANSRIFVLLVGENTRYLHRYIRWEIELAISSGLPIIVVNINGMKYCDIVRCPNIAKETLAVHISFSAKIMQYALETWPELHAMYSDEGKTAQYRYIDSVYENLR